MNPRRLTLGSLRKFLVQSFELFTGFIDRSVHRKNREQNEDQDNNAGYKKVTHGM